MCSGKNHVTASGPRVYLLEKLAGNGGSKLATLHVVRSNTATASSREEREREREIYIYIYICGNIYI